MKRILHVMPLTSWLAWFGAFVFAMLYRYSKATVPESIGKVLLVTVAVLVSYAIFATQQRPETQRIQKLQHGSLSDKRLANEMNDERNQMIIGKAAFLSIKWIVLLNIAALFVMAALDVSSVAIVLLALSTIMIPILNIILQVHLNRTM